MDVITLNLKEGLPSVEFAIAQFEIELERAKVAQAKFIKIIHGYGSSGAGGAICVNLRKYLSKLKREGEITDFITGDNWNIFNDVSRKLILKYKVVDDFSNSNPGITIVVV